MLQLIGTISFLLGVGFAATISPVGAIGFYAFAILCALGAIEKKLG